MEKKQYTAPKAEFLDHTFEDIIVASGEPIPQADEKIELPLAVFDK